MPAVLTNEQIARTQIDICLSCELPSCNEKHEDCEIRRLLKAFIVHVERPGVSWSGGDTTEMGIARLDHDLRLQNVGGLSVLRSNVRALMSLIDPAPSGLARSLPARSVAKGAVDGDA